MVTLGGTERGATVGLGIGRIVGALRALGLKRAAIALSGAALTAGAVSIGANLLSDQAARAQNPPGYYDAGYEASNLPGFRLSIQTSTIDPTDTTTLNAVYGSPSSPDAPARSERIETLARSLENDPDRIYQFVRNTILFEPQFGLHKGADGVLLDGSGGAFDQSQLMIELLRASDIDARYVLGTVTLGSEAATILRVSSARQACLLLAAAGTPATVNGSTNCTSLSGSVTAVQMRHVWVEALIGGNWYAFDPSLKTNTPIVGVDLWDAANTTAASAWSNVASGVSVSGGNLNGVNAQYIQTDLATYAEDLQTSLSEDYSDRSLEELTGGWEIVRTEAVLRNATLPGSGGSLTRWNEDVPAPYRATLRMQTAGFDHTFDLPSIYAWRVQAQIQGRRLKVAVRKEEHIDAAATAYLAEYGAPQCTPIVICGAEDTTQVDFDNWNRRFNLTINHPYVARRPGVNPATGQAWDFGTFADETVVKSLEQGKRADILVRTAGGNGGRRAVWAAANDPIQQHRIIPAGNDYNECMVNPATYIPWEAIWVTNEITAGQCDGQSGVDWQYWLQNSPYGNGAFAYGEVAIAEMGTKKDGLINLWTDLFDKTVSVLEPLSGARIFHQHSIGLASTPGYVENVLDVDTSVGIAPQGSDQPHHILSALASLAVTEEALALGHSASERPLFQGSPIQATAASRMATATGLKVLTTSGSTSGLPADVTADTRAQIETYLAKGFTVVSTTTADGNAFLARRNDGSEQAWILRSRRVGQTPDVDTRTYFLKGAETEVPNPVDYLGAAESRRIAANVAGTQLGAVDLRMGTLSFSEGSELSIGQGAFPYSLSFSRTYVSTGPIEGSSGLGMGWTHNWQSSVSHSTDTGVLLPDAEAVTAAPMLMAAMIALEAGRADTVQASVVSGIALDWLQAQVAANVVNVNGGGQSGRFVRLVDGTWRNPASPTESLAPATEPFIGAYTRELNWTLADRSVMAFRDIENPDPSPDRQDLQGVLTTWTFPTNVVITLDYAGGTETNRPTLASVSNNLGATLTFTHTQSATRAQTDSCYAQANAMFPEQSGGYRGAQQVCHELSTSGGRLTRVQAGPDEINFTHFTQCPRIVNFCAFQLATADRPGLRKRSYSYGLPTGALASASTSMDYQQVLTQVTDEGVTTPRARFDWRAVGGQVAPYVAEAFDAQDRKTVYYSSTFTYSSAKDAVNAVVRQTYDPDGRLATSADGMGRTARATYDGPGRSETIRTAFGDLTEFTYDPRGNLIERRQTPITGCETGLTVKQQGWWCQEIVVTAEYDAYWNKPTKITLPATAADPTVPRIWDLDYHNVSGLLIEQIGPVVRNGITDTDARPVWETEYDGFGRVVRTEDPTGIATTQTWSTGGGGIPAFCLVGTVAPGPTPITTTFGCDAVGNVTTTTVEGFTTTTTYDDLRRKVEETGPAGTNIRSWIEYDLNGDPFKSHQRDFAAGTWRTTETTYSATHQPLTVTDPSGDVSRTCYDAVDRPVTVIDGDRRATHTVYNAAGQPTEIHRYQRAAVDSCSISTELPLYDGSPGFTETRWRRFLYNTGGLQSAEIDARGNTTSQVYDGLGRLARTVYPDAREDWTAHDQRGQVVFRRIRSNHQTSIFYDALGRDFHVREHTQADENYQWKGRNSRAAYDLAGRPVWRDVSTQSTTGTTFNTALLRDVRNYQYTAGFLTTDQWRPDGTATNKPNLSFTYGYADGRGNRTSVSWPVAAGQPAWAATYVFDGAGRASSVSFPGAGGTQTVALTYDSLSRRTAIDRPGAAADTTYTYEVDSDLASLNHAFVPGAGPGPLSFTYGHDAAGKTTSIEISQPAFEWMPSLTYARSYGVANNMNQITSEAGVPVTFSSAGDMTTDGVTNFGYTFGHRLVAANRSGMTATYDYDSDDRRTRKVVNGVVTRTMWSGADEMAEVNSAGVVLRRFIPDGSGAMDARLATVENDGPQTVYWIHTDHQGSVVATSNSAAQTVGVATYSPHGEFGTGVSAPPLGSPFGYTGRQFDPETGLYQYRARYYSPRLGQFLSADPIGTKDDPNLYLYVANDPVNMTDPTGMQSSCPRRGPCPDVPLPNEQHREEGRANVSQSGGSERGSNLYIDRETGQTREEHGTAAGQGSGNEFEHHTSRRPSEDRLLTHAHIDSDQRGATRAQLTRLNNAPSTEDQDAMHGCSCPIQIVGPDVAGTLYRENRQDIFHVDRGRPEDIPSLRQQQIIIEWGEPPRAPVP